MTATSRSPGFRGEFLWELDIATKQIVAVAEAAPSASYPWRPTPKTRSISEVFVHVAAGGFMLMDVMGIPAPADRYPQLAPSGQERTVAVIHRNDELEAALREKGAVVAILKRSLSATKNSFTRATANRLR